MMPRNLKFGQRTTPVGNGMYLEPFPFGPTRYRLSPCSAAQDQKRRTQGPHTTAPDGSTEPLAGCDAPPHDGQRGFGVGLSAKMRDQRFTSPVLGLR